MKFQTHNDKEININGTSGQEDFIANYSDLVKCFGEPLLDVSGDEKTDAEWNIEFEDGTVASIYNWKNGKNFDCENGDYVKDISEWNIGGENETAVIRVHEALDESKKHKAKKKTTKNTH
jgi:hypothetical protein